MKNKDPVSWNLLQMKEKRISERTSTHLALILGCMPWADSMLKQDGFVSGPSTLFFVWHVLFGRKTNFDFKWYFKEIVLELSRSRLEKICSHYITPIVWFASSLIQRDDYQPSWWNRLHSWWCDFIKWSQTIPLATLGIVWAWARRNKAISNL